MPIFRMTSGCALTHGPPRDLAQQRIEPARVWPSEIGSTQTRTPPRPGAAPAPHRPWRRRRRRVPRRCRAPERPEDAEEAAGLVALPSGGLPDRHATGSPPGWFPKASRQAGLTTSTIRHNCEKTLKAALKRDAHDIPACRSTSPSSWPRRSRLRSPPAWWASRSASSRRRYGCTCSRRRRPRR